MSPFLLIVAYRSANTPMNGPPSGVRSTGSMLLSESAMISMSIVSVQGGLGQISNGLIPPSRSTIVSAPPGPNGFGPSGTPSTGMMPSPKPLRSTNAPSAVMNESWPGPMGDALAVVPAKMANVATNLRARYLLRLMSSPFPR